MNQRGNIIVGLLLFGMITAGTMVLLDQGQGFTPTENISRAKQNMVQLELFLQEKLLIDLVAWGGNTEFPCTDYLGNLPTDGTPINSLNLGEDFFFTTLGTDNIIEVNLDTIGFDYTIVEMSITPAIGYTLRYGVQADLSKYQLQITARHSNGHEVIGLVYLVVSNPGATDTNHVHNDPIKACGLFGSLTEQCLMFGLDPVNCDNDKLSALAVASVCENMVIDGLLEEAPGGPGPLFLGTGCGVDTTQGPFGKDCCDPEVNGSWVRKAYIQAGIIENP